MERRKPSAKPPPEMGGSVQEELERRVAARVKAAAAAGQSGGAVGGVVRGRAGAEAGTGPKRGHPGDLESGGREGDGPEAGSEIGHVSESALSRLKRRISITTLSIPQQTTEKSSLIASGAMRLRSKLGCVARKHRSVTVVFIDIVGFSELCRSVSAQLVMELLDEAFSRFDEVASENSVLKLRTIGDGYLACAGLMSAFGDGKDSIDHAKRALDFCVGVGKSVEGMLMPNSAPLLLRMGLHSGEVFSGIVGTTQPQYDLFGHVPNVAARMEQTAKPGHVHMTISTKDLITERYPTHDYNIVPRDKIKMKGVGEVVTFELDVQNASGGEKTKQGHGHRSPEGRFKGDWLPAEPAPAVA